MSANERTDFKANPIYRFFSKNVILIALIVLCALLSFATDRFLTVNNITNVMLQSATTGLVAVGMTFVIITGGIDLSVGSIVALAAALGAGIMKDAMKIMPAAWTIVVSIVIMLAIGTLIGLLQGLLISMLKMPAFIVTLAGMSIARSLTMVYTGGKTISGLPEEFASFGSNRIGGWLPVPVIILVVIFLISFYVLQYTAFGRSLYALGGNREAAKLSGINTNRIETITYAISGLASGIAAVVLTARLATATSTAGEGYELEAIGAVVIGGASLAGGRGTMLGTFIGVLILGVINNGQNLLNINPFFKGCIHGAVILIAVLIDTLRKRNEVS
jgi:ribose transport system permease protein